MTETPAQPRPPKPPKKKRRWLRRTLWTMFALGLLGVVGLVVAYVVTPIPKANERALQQNSIIYYADGKTVLDRFSTVNRQSVSLDRVPEQVQKAFLAAEDRTFYTNSGISPKGIARSVWVGLKGGPQQGGSTITQQYVKNYYLTQDRTLTRKAKEIMISIKIDGEVPKDQILEDYLNTIYFGRGADGIQTAAQAYFGQGVQNLDVAQGALLAAIIRGPSFYDPQLGPEQKTLAEGRWNYVLDGMVAQGWLSAGERAKLTFPETRPISKSSGLTGPNGFVSEAIREELKTKLKLTDTDLALGGLRIVSTIDKQAQDAAIEAVKNGMPTGAGTEDLHVGLAAVAPGDGAVRAMYGGATYGSGPLGYFNTATDAGMQAGSTFKVWTMIAALERGIPLSTRFNSNSPIFLPEFASHEAGATAAAQAGEVQNFGNHSYGVVDMATATALSANTYYAQLNVEVSPEATKQMAGKAGIRAAGAQKTLGTNYANVFGTDLVRPLDQAAAYATIAAEGKYAAPYFIASVKGTGTFEINYKAKPKPKQVFAENVARDAIQAMHRVTQPGGTAAGAAALGRPAAGKTGTTSNNYSAWFDGFTPGQLAAAVGIYKGDGSLTPQNQMVNIGGYGEVTGATIPLTIWNGFMAGALDGQPIAQLPPPGNVTGGTPSVATTAPSMQSTPPPSSSSSSSSSSTSASESTSSTSGGTISSPPGSGTTTPPTSPTTPTTPTDPGTSTSPASTPAITETPPAQSPTETTTTPPAQSTDTPSPQQTV